MAYAASFLPPPTLPSTDATRPAPPWILLDTLAYISDHHNGTKAEAFTSTNQKLIVSFFTAPPPAVSHFAVHCPGRNKEDFVREPCVVHSDRHLALLSLSLKDGGDGTTDDYFIYTAGQPSLHLIPGTDRHISTMTALASVAFVPYDDGSEHFVLVALGFTFTRGQYELRVFRSEFGTWTEKLLPVGTSALGPNMIYINPAKVINLGGGDIGWVDLWNGILVCNVFVDDPAFRVIPLPYLLPANHVYRANSSPEQFRDVVCTTDGLIKFVEMEYCRRRIVREIPDVSASEVIYDSEITLGKPVDDGKDTYEYLGWRIVTWNRTVDSNCWRRGSVVHVNDILVNNPSHSLLLPDLVDKNALKKLQTGFPALSMDHSSDVVHLVSKVKPKDRTAWVVTIDMRNKTLEEVAPFSAERCMYIKPGYVTCALAKYLNTSNKSSAPKHKRKGGPSVSVNELHGKAHPTSNNQSKKWR